MCVTRRETRWLKACASTAIATGLFCWLTSSAAAEFRIGVAGPVSGTSASFGEQLVNGVKQAVADINAGGGILSEKVSIVVGDDVADPRQGVSVANRFVAEGLRVVIGHINSGTTLPASEVYAENGMLMITPTSTNPLVTERGMWNVFRVCGRDDQQGKVAGAYLAQHFRDKHVAIAHDKSTAAIGLADETKKAMNAAGLTEVLYEGVNSGEKDYSAFVSKLKQNSVDVLYWGGLYTEAGLIVRQMRDQGLTTVLMGGDGIASAEYAAIGGPGVEGTRMTFAPDPRKRPEAKVVVDELAANGMSAESYTLYSYAAVQVIKQAAEKAASLDPQKIADAIHSGATFGTVVGNLTYDAKGDVTSPTYVMYTWRKDLSGHLSYSED